MTQSQSLSAPSAWLATELSALLSAAADAASAPHAAPPREDAFSSRFDGVFVRHARGLVGGREVDREGLKQALLALQKRWSPAQCRYEDCESLHRRIDGFHVGIPLPLAPRAACRLYTLAHARLAFSFLLRVRSRRGSA